VTELPQHWVDVERLVKAAGFLTAYAHPDLPHGGQRLNLKSKDSEQADCTSFRLHIELYQRAAASFRNADIDRKTLARHVLEQCANEKRWGAYSIVFQELNRDELLSLLPEIVDHMVRQENLMWLHLEYPMNALPTEITLPLLLETFERHLFAQQARSWEELELESWAVLTLPVAQAHLSVFLDIMNRVLGPEAGKRWQAEQP